MARRTLPSRLELNKLAGSFNDWSTSATQMTDPDKDGLLDPTGFVAEVPMIDPEYRTLYARFGEGLNTLVVLALVVLGFRRRRDA